MEMEKIAVKYYDELANGRIMGRKDPNTGDIEWPPVLASNKTGNFDLEWVEMSGRGKMYSLFMPGLINTKPENEDLSPYCYGQIVMDGCDSINAIVKGVSRKNKEEIRAKLPVDVRAIIVHRDGYDFVAFELDEE